MQINLRKNFKNQILRQWKILINLSILLNLKLRDYFSDKVLDKEVPKLFYSGAISGNYGGPRIKVSQLRQEFNESILNFNIAYVLSNYPYLSATVLERLNKAKIPIVLNQNGVYTRGWYGDNWDARNLPNSLVYERCDYVFWQSNFAKEASQIFLSRTKKSGEILHNAVDLQKYFPINFKHQNSFVFLIAGKFTSHASFYQIEGALKALVALKKERNIKVRIAGLSNMMKRKVLDLSSILDIQDRVEILGKYRQKDWPETMRNSDAYLALKFQDTCPNLVLEAMASGLPVIYSRSGGTPELVDEYSGIGLKADGDWATTPLAPNSHEIAEAMLALKENKIQMGIAARNRVEEKFDLNRWYSRHLDVFEYLLRKRIE